MRDIALCHPRMQKIAAQWITACKAEGINVAISETLRTAAEQDALYAKGRTKPGNIVTNAKGSSYRSQLIMTVKVISGRLLKLARNLVLPGAETGPAL